MPSLGETPAFFGDACGALESLLELHRAEARQQRIVAGDRAGYRRGVDAVAGHACLLERVGEERRRPPARREAGRVERVEFLVLRRIDEREQVAADAGVVLRGHVQHRAGRHCRIDRVPALPKNLEACFSGDRIARGNHAVSRDHFGSSLPQPALRARAAHRLDVRAGLWGFRRWDAEGRFRLAVHRHGKEGDDEGGEGGVTHAASWRLFE